MTASVSEAASGRAIVKSPAAFRTIAEVATDLDLPAHVLRFWESKFPQIKPLKRRGGRRYYRPEDVALLRRIRSLLYTDGYTIKGVQRLLREGSRGGAAPADSDVDEAEADLVEEGGEPGEPEHGEPEHGEAPAEAAGSAPEDARSSAPGSGRDVLRQVLADLEAIRALLREHGY